MSAPVSAMVPHDAERAVAVFGVELLLDRREEAVEVDMEEAEAVCLGSRAHGLNIRVHRFAFYLPMGSATIALFPQEI